MVDEADKAPLEVVTVLKGLLEDQEMLLADGRRLMSAERAAEEMAVEGDSPVSDRARHIVPIHPNFRLWVLANRPGFPFLGQDFFRECGDIFATHVCHVSALGGGVRQCGVCMCKWMHAVHVLWVKMCGHAELNDMLCRPGD